MNVQEKLAAIEQHTAKALIEIRELMLELAETDPQNTPPAVASFAMRAAMRAVSASPTLRILRGSVWMCGLPPACTSPAARSRLAGISAMAT